MIRPSVSLFLLVALAGSAAAAQPVPLGPEMRVDTVESRQPDVPFVAAQAGGGFEIAWSYKNAEAPLVVARHFDADGAPTDASPVALGGLGPYPSVRGVTATNGGFEVLWQLGGSPRQPHYRRHLDLRGTPAPGKPVQMGGTGWSTRWVWQVRGSGFMDGWPIVKNHMPVGLAVQRLDTSGGLTGPVLRLNSRLVYDDDRPILAGLAGGGFLAVWNGVISEPVNTYRSVVRARRFSPAGKPLGSDFDVHSKVPEEGDILHSPRVATAPGGGFAVAWSFFDSGASASTPYLRLFDAAGRPRGREIPGPATADRVEAMAFDAAGRLLVLWGEGLERPGEVDLEAQLFGPRAEALGPPERIATEASGRFQRPLRGNVAWAEGSWLVTWVAETDEGYLGPKAVFVRRFAGEEEP
ncbi:MAG: hypothetical protein ABUT39_08700 [Acidobacteriota bacterium]